MQRAEEGDYVVGHCYYFYRDGRGQLHRDVIILKAPARDLVQILRERLYVPEVEKHIERNNHTKEWIGPWTSGTPDEARNPIEVQCYFEADLISRNDPRRGLRTMIIRRKFEDIEFYVWNRDAFVEEMRDGLKDEFEVLSINGLSIGTYISVKNPVERIKTHWPLAARTETVEEEEEQEEKK